MSADPTDRRQLGKLLVDKGLLTEAQLQLALAEQAASGAPLGEVLVGLGFSKGPTIGNALAEQHGGPLRTEYGLALGPSDVTAAPRPIKKLQAQPSDHTRLPRHPDPFPEQGNAITQLTAALNERTEELEHVRTELAAIKQHQTELAPLKAELVQAREERARAEQAASQREEELARVDRECAQHAVRVEELEQELDTARSERNETGDARSAERELELALQWHKTEVAGIRAELAQALQERTMHANRAQELERSVERLEIELALARQQLTRAERSLTLALEQSDARLTLAAQDRADDAQRLEEAQRQLTAALSQSETADTDRVARCELDLVLQQHSAAVTALNAELTLARDEQTKHANRARTLERQLEQSLARESNAAGTPTHRRRARARLQTTGNRTDTGSRAPVRAC